ncbi:MAG: DUF1207 domain-containing protein [Bacteroidota bacterium]
MDLNKRLISTLLFLTVVVGGMCQDSSRVEWLPKGRLFDPLYLDPLEAQAYASLTAFNQGGEWQEYLYAPFAFGFYKGWLRWKKEKCEFEFGADWAAFTQFQVDGITEGASRWMLNVDYKASAVFHYRRQEKYELRARFYHLSSHWGDDFIIRNGITSFIPNPVNYEQLEVTGAIRRGIFRPYATLSYGVRPSTIRKRLLLQAGFTFEKRWTNSRYFAWIGGMDVKSWHQNDFYPNTKAAVGLQFGQQGKTPVRILLEGYNGHMPYSVFENRRVGWIGMGMYFDVG